MEIRQNNGRWYAVQVGWQRERASQQFASERLVRQAQKAGKLVYGAWYDMPGADGPYN